MRPIQQLISRLLPFIFAGIAVMAFVFGIMILAYLFIFGAIVGLVLFIISFLREKFFSIKKTTPSKQKSGRIIDIDDWKKL